MNTDLDKMKRLSLGPRGAGRGASLFDEKKYKSKVDTKYDEQYVGSAGTEMSQIMVDNKLSYVIPSNVNVATSATNKKQFFQRRDYGPGDTAVCILNTGSSYINCKNSYLVYTIEVPDVGGAFSFDWGVGSGVNVFREIKVQSRSGTELYRGERLNKYMAQYIRYQHSKDWIQTIGKMAGIGVVYSATDVAIVARITIPICMLGGFFEPLNDLLLPPQIASGLRLELNIENLNTAIRQITGTAITSFSVNDIFFNLETVSLMDQQQLLLNKASASDGLEYTFKRYFLSTNTYPSETSQKNLEVRKAVSQATFAFCTYNDLTSENVITDDSMASGPYNVKAFRYRIGSQYYPLDFVADSTRSAGLTKSESYFFALQSFAKTHNRDDVTSVEITNTDANVNTFSNTMSVLAQSFERNQMLNLSGVPISNSRVLELEIDQETSVGTQFQYNIFLEYLAICKAYLDNTVLKV